MRIGKIGADTFVEVLKKGRIKVERYSAYCKVNQAKLSHFSQAKIITH